MGILDTRCQHSAMTIPRINLWILQFLTNPNITQLWNQLGGNLGSEGELLQS